MQPQVGVRRGEDAHRRRPARPRAVLGDRHRKNRSDGTLPTRHRPAATDRDRERGSRTRLLLGNTDVNPGGGGPGPSDGGNGHATRVLSRDPRRWGAACSARGVVVHRDLVRVAVASGVPPRSADRTEPAALRARRPLEVAGAFVKCPGVAVVIGAPALRVRGAARDAAVAADVLRRAGERARRQWEPSQRADVLRPSFSAAHLVMVRTRGRISLRQYPPMVS